MNCKIKCVCSHIPTPTNVHAPSVPRATDKEIEEHQRKMEEEKDEMGRTDSR